MKSSTRIQVMLQAITVMAAMMIVQSAHGATYSGGAGTSDDPWQIANATDWTTLAATPADWSKHFLMIADIDFQGASLTPVGNSSKKFTGVFDGGGHVLSNAVFDLATAEPWLQSDKYVGVFGSVGFTGVLNNLGVENVTMTSYEYAGGLVGINDGTIASCYATGAVTGTGGFHLGGLVGYSSATGTIISCYAAATVTGNNHVGGLVGTSLSTITSCYATGAVTGTSAVGGLVGEFQGSEMKSCYATGTVTGSGSVGGLVGETLIPIPIRSCFWDRETTGQDGSAGGKGLTTSQMQTSLNYSNADWSAYEWVMQEGAYPRLVWEVPDGAVIPAAAPVPLTGSGTQSDPYRVTSPSEFALLSWHAALLDKHILLAADIDLAEVSLFPIGDLGPFTGVFDGGGHVVRNAVVNLPTSSYVGVFGYVGRGGVLRDLCVEDVLVTGYRFVGGLVGINQGSITSCYVTGTLTGENSVGGLTGKNFGNSVVTSCYAAVAVTGGGLIGGLVGDNSPGTVSSCYATGTVTGSDSVGGLVGKYQRGEIKSCYATGTVMGNDYVGGLVGRSHLNSPITMCYATGAVTGDEAVGGLVGYADDDIAICYATGAVTGNAGVGGLAAFISGDITSCYARGSVKGIVYVGGLVGEVGSSTTIKSCYSTGTVKGNNDVGGLVGLTYGAIKLCYWDMDTSGHSTSDGGEGRMTIEMTYPYAENTYLEWDFTEIWGADIDGNLNQGYPYLLNIVPVPNAVEGEDEPVEGEDEPAEGEQPGGEGEPDFSVVAETLLQQFEDGDTNSDGLLSYDEALVVFPEITRAQFDEFDANKDGQLSKEELESYLKEAGNGCFQGCRKDKRPADTVKRMFSDWLLVGMTLLILLRNSQTVR
jgi:hypothetical protein